MKRCLGLILAVLLLAGCGNLYPDDYLSVESNQAPYAYRETTVPTTAEPEETEPRVQSVTALPEIRDGIVDLLLSGGKSVRFLLDEYRGDTENLPDKVMDNLMTNKPKSVYAAKSLDMTMEKSGGHKILLVNLEPSITPEEYRAIPTIGYLRANDAIFNALKNHVSAYTVEISTYQETDYKKLLDAYILRHPDEIMEAPRISVDIFPEEEGNIRVLHFQFEYQTSQKDLQEQQNVVKILLESYQLRFRDIDEPDEILEALYMLLVPAGGYTADDDANVYSLFFSRVGSSRMMATVASYYCSHAGFESGVVIGERKTGQVEEPGEDGTEKPRWEPWYWNWIWDGERYLFFDLHAAALNETEPSLLTMEEMPDYRWDPENNPEIKIIEPTEPTGPEETGPTEDLTEEPIGEATAEPTGEPTSEPTEADPDIP